MAVTRVVKSDYSYKSYLIDKQDEIQMWLITMQKSCNPYFLPPPMYKMWYDNTLYSIKHDFNMIIEEYGFW